MQERMAADECRFVPGKIPKHLNLAIKPSGADKPSVLESGAEECMSTKSRISHPQVVYERGTVMRLNQKWPSPNSGNVCALRL